jgi:lysyl-tRNA synthetase class 2
VRETFRRRSRVVSFLRSFMDGRGFIEVETPVLLAEAGGRRAPLHHHHNALDEDRFLRIATELHLKRLIVGGLDKVYEIGRIFRNEGVSTKHNPEFTMLESYEAYADYHDVARMVEEMISGAAIAATGAARVPHKGGEIDFTPPWPRRTMRDLLVEHAGFDFEQFRDLAALRAEIERRGLHAPPGLGWGKLIDELWSAQVEPKLVQPVFVLDYPVELSPLAKRKPDAPHLVERFEAFAGGFEIANAYSDAQRPGGSAPPLRGAGAAARRRGTRRRRRSMRISSLRSSTACRPRRAGRGHRPLLMVLLDQASIREVILFPQLRRES